MLSAAREIIATFRFRDEASDALKKIGRETENLGEEARETEEHMKSMAGSLKDLAIGMASAFSTQQLFSGMNRAFTDYEKGMIGVAKTTNMAGQEFSAFTSAFDTMAMDMSVPVADLQAIAQAAGQLGIKGSENILAFTETIAKLQTATDLTAEDAAMALARIANITGEGVEGVENYANVVVALGNNVAATEGEITRIATEIARSTSVYEFSTTQVAAYAAAFAQIGVQAEIGGTSLGRVLREIDLAAAQGGEGMQNLSELTGMMQQQFAALVETDPSKALNLFLQSLGPTLNDSGKLANVLKSLNLQGEEINKTIIPLAKNYELLGESMRIASQGEQQAMALNKEYDQFAEARASTLTRLGNQIELIMKNLGAAFDTLLAPALEALENLLSNLAEWFGNLPGPIQTVISALAVLAPAIVGLVTIIGGLGAALPLIVGGLTTVAGGVVALGTSMTVALGPIGLLLAAFGTLGGLYLSAGQDIGEFTGALSNADSALQAYNTAVETAAARQGDLRGRTDEATQAMLEQSRVQLLAARDELQNQVREADRDVRGLGWNPFNVSDSNAMADEITDRFTSSIQTGELPGVPAVDELIGKLRELNEGKIELADLYEPFQKLATVSNGAQQEMIDLRNTMRDGGVVSKEDVSRVIEVARQTGLFTERIKEWSQETNADTRVTLFRQIQDDLISVMILGESLRSDEDSWGLVTQAEKAVTARDRIQEINDRLGETIAGGIRMNALDPLGVFAQQAQTAVTAMAELSATMDSLPKDMQTSIKAFEGSTSGVEAARDIIRDREGFRSEAYADMAKRSDGSMYNSGWRAGWGSDTTTRLGNNGQEVVVRIKQGDSVTREDADRDLTRRIRDEYMPAAMAAAGAAWANYTPAQQGALTSLSYNYGADSWNQAGGLGRIKGAVSSGDANAVAQAILSLSGDNAGQNASRRQYEAAFFENGVGQRGQDSQIDRQLTEEQRTREDNAKKEEDRLKREADTRAKAQADFLKSISDTSAGIELETRTLNMNTREKSELIEKERLLAQARQNGIALNEMAGNTGRTNLQLIEEEAAKVGMLAENLEKAQKVKERLDNVGGAFMTEFDNAVDRTVEGLGGAKQLAEGTVEAIGSGIGTFLDLMADENVKFMDALRGTAASVLSDIGRMLIEHAMKVLVFKNLLGFLGGGSGPDNLPTALTVNAQGNAFDLSGVQRFAQGGDFTNGVYSQPTMFSFGGGKLGVMGEAGPEAVMPLSRSEKGGYGIRFQTVDPITKKKVERIIPISRDNAGTLIASDAQFFARGDLFGERMLSSQLAGNRGDAGVRPIVDNMTIATSINVPQGSRSNDEASSKRLGAAVENEIRSAVVDTVTKMMAPGGMLWNK